MQYTFRRGAHNVHYLTAPYALLVKALHCDGTTESRDEYKQKCQWTRQYDDGWFEVYDYHSYVARENILDWHVQAGGAGIEALFAALDKAVEE